MSFVIGFILGVCFAGGLVYAYIRYLKPETVSGK